MAIRSTIKSWIKKVFRKLNHKDPAGRKREAGAPTASAEEHSYNTIDTEQSNSFLLEKYLVSEKAKIEYVDQLGSRTSRTIKTEEVYEYSDGKLAIRAYCYKRKGYRTFIGSRIQSWKDIATGTIVTNLGEYLKRRSESDPGNVAETVYASLLVEIRVAIGTLIKYQKSFMATGSSISGVKKMALIDYVLEKPEVIVALSILPEPEREDARDLLILMIGSTSINETTYEVSKRIFKKAGNEKKLSLIQFIEERLAGERSQKSAVQILADDLRDTGSKGEKTSIPLNKNLLTNEIDKIKKAGANAKKTYKKKKRQEARSKYYRSYERNNPVKLLAIEHTINYLTEKANANEDVFNRAEFERDIVNTISLAMTSKELEEEGEMFRKRCDHGISVGLLSFGLKKKNRGWYINESGEEVIDLRNASAD